MDTPVPHKDLFWGKPRKRVSFLLLSVLIHYIFLLILFLFSPKINHKQFDHYFDRNAMQVINLASSARIAKPAEVVTSKPLTPYRKVTASLSKIKSVPRFQPTLPPTIMNNEPHISPGQKEVAMAEIVLRRGRSIHKEVNYMLVNKASEPQRITKLESFVEDKPQTKKRLTSNPLPAGVGFRPSIKEKIEIQTITGGQHTATGSREQETVIKPVNGQLNPLNYYRKWRQRVGIAPASVRRGVRERAVKYEGRDARSKPLDISRAGVNPGGQVKELKKRRLEKRSGWWHGVIEQVKGLEPLEAVDSFNHRGLVAGSGGAMDPPRVIREKLTLSEASLELGQKSRLGIAPASVRRGVRERAVKYEGRDAGFKPLDISRAGVNPGGQVKELKKRRLEKGSAWWPDAVEQVGETGPLEVVDSFSRRGVMAGSGGAMDPPRVIREKLTLVEASLEQDKKSRPEIAPASVRRGVRARAVKYEGRDAGFKPVDISRAGVSYHMGHTEVDRKYPHQPQLITDTSYISKSITPQVVKAVKQEFDVNPMANTPFVLSGDKLVVPDNPVQRKGKALISSTASKEITKTAYSLKKESGDYHHSNYMFGKKRLGSVKVFNKGVKLYSSQLADILQHNLILGDLTTEEAYIKMELNLPPGNKTSQQLYQLTGYIDSSVRTAFLTINDITQLLQLANGVFKAEVALQEGVNGLSLIAISSGGKRSVKSFQLIFVPPLGGVPRISLDSPRNGVQGVREGDRLIVEGTISDNTITQAILLINKVPIKIEVRAGHFKKQVFLPKGRVITFRVMARNKNGIFGYSPLHTALSAYEAGVNNQRPF